MELSLACVDDAALFDQVADDVFDHAIDPRQLGLFLSDPRHHIAIAVNDGVIIGFASGVEQFHPDKLPSLFINEVGVSPEFQGRRIGKRLLSLLLEHATSLGCATAWVLTEADNLPANRLYRALFEPANLASVAAVPNVMYEFDLGSA